MSGSPNVSRTHSARCDRGRRRVGGISTLERKEGRYLIRERRKTGGWLGEWRARSAPDLQIVVVSADTFERMQASAARELRDHMVANPSFERIRGDVLSRHRQGDVIVDLRDDT